MNNRISVRAPSPMQAYTFHHTLTSPAKSISTNKEGTQCLVGGRNLLKIFQIEDRRFTEKLNLVAGSRKLDYSITDVQWHPVDENIVASAAGNGAVILWDLNKESKLDRLFKQNLRSVNRICFHPIDPYLLSCSQDGNMHCFDTRLKEIKLTFFGKTVSIRDVQFHPTDRNIFCAACESGNVQLWDIRKPDGYYNQFTAHIEPVFTLNWHPEEMYWLSTGGRDKSIKIWDIAQQCMHPTHNIQTIGPVHKIKWRPGHKYCIASCALILDNDINIWDIRRPYLPFASFQEHVNAATGIVWQKDTDVLISCSEDKTIYHHAMDDAEKPIENAPHVALGLAPNGIIGHAFPNNDLKPIPQKNSLGSRLNNAPPQAGKRFGKINEMKQCTSTLVLHDVREWIDETWIEKLALNYRFHGRPFSELCEHNSKVASELKLADKAYTWLILKQMYSSENILHQNTYMTNQNSFLMSHPSPRSSTSNHLLTNDRFLAKVESPESFYDVCNDSSSSDDDSGMPHTAKVLRPNSNSNEMAVVGPELDDVFGDDDYNNQFFSNEMGGEDDDLEQLPSEAFQLRQSFGEKVVQPSENITLEGRADNFPTFEVPRWTFEDLVKDMLYHYANQGDLQMCVTVLLTLKDIGRNMINTEVQEEWFSGYLEILSHLHLLNVSTEVINHAPDPINQKNKSSTTVNIQCDWCKKKLDHSHPGWYCKTCNKICQVCSICHIPVKGLYAWCQGCGHGGHLQHLKEWYESNSFCPMGCGHKCEFS